MLPIRVEGNSTICIPNSVAIIKGTDKLSEARWLVDYLLSAEFFADLPDVGDHEDALFPRLAEEGRLYAFRSRTYWKAIDTVKDLNEAAGQLAAQAK